MLPLGVEYVLDLYLAELSKQRATANKVEAANLNESDADLVRPVPDFAKRTWDAMRASGSLPPIHTGIEYSPREDGVGTNVPNICLKIPTGGGKTFASVVQVTLRVPEQCGPGAAQFRVRPQPNERQYQCAVRAGFKFTGATLYP